MNTNERKKFIVTLAEDGYGLPHGNAKIVFLAPDISVVPILKPLSPTMTSETLETSPIKTSNTRTIMLDRHEGQFYDSIEEKYVPIIIRSAYDKDSDTLFIGLHSSIDGQTISNP